MKLIQRLLHAIYSLFFPCPGKWEPGEKLIRWSRVGPNLTVAGSFEGTLAIGASGSGKTSGPVRMNAISMMRAGYGMFAQTVKGTNPSDADLIRQWAVQAGRENSLVFVGPGHGLGFNVLRHEMDAAHRGNESGDMAANVSRLFSIGAELSLSTRNRTGGDQIWMQAVNSLSTYGTTLVYAATADLRLDDLVAVVQSAPQTLAQSKDPTFLRDSACMRMIEAANIACPANRNVQLATRYFLHEFPSFPPETKQSVLFTFGAGCADFYQREPLNSMFFSRTDYTPSIILDGAILVVDCAVLQFGEVGRIANGLLRFCIQRALERRVGHPSERPVALLWDESQKTLMRSDVSFQETCRSSRCATIAGTQHLPSLRDAVGADLAANFVGNLRNKFFAQNNEPETAEFMSRLGGKYEDKRRSINRDNNGVTGSSEAPHMEDALPAQATHNLRTGGRANRYKVDSILVAGSKRMRSGKPFQKVRIDQRLILPSWWPLSGRARVTAKQRPAPDFRYLRKDR